MEIKLNFTPITRREFSPVGININYLRDADINRQQARPLRETVKSANMGYLRYPGGAKSDAVLHFAAPDFECKPQPLVDPYVSFATQAEPMHFDEFMAVCHHAGCEPHVVVGCDTVARRKATQDEFLENAVRWVRYAKEKGYKVKYWEIGNENWNEKDIPPDEFGKIVARFSKAMKAEDPSILIGASGKDEEWWEAFLPHAKDDVDFLCVSDYACWGYMRYDTYVNTDDVELLSEAYIAVNSIKKFAPEHEDRMFVVISEFNSRDYAKEFKGAGWKNANNLGHALVNFDMCGQIAKSTKIKYGMIWTTRWMYQENQNRDIFYGFDSNNGLLPSTMCPYIWGKFARKDVLDVPCPPGLVGFASKDETGLTVFLITKRDKMTVNLTAPEEVKGTAKTFIYGGTEPSDQYPDLRPGEDYKMGEEITLPPYSLMVFDWKN